MKRSGPPVRDLGKRVLLREAEGIIRRALSVLPDLLARGDFAVIGKAQDEFNERTDYLLTFVREALLFDDPSAITATKNLSWALEAFKEQTGNQHSRTTVKHLEPELVKRGAGRIRNNRDANGRQVWSVKGVRLKSPDTFQLGG